jgi:parallel beta-helix repeat protein
MKKQNCIKLSTIMVFFLFLATTIASAKFSFIDERQIVSLEDEDNYLQTSIIQQNAPDEKTNQHTTILDEYESIKVTEWSDPNRNKPYEYHELNHPPRVFKDRIISSSKNNDDLVVLFVDEELYIDISEKIDRFTTDLINDGFSVEVHVGVYGIAEDLKLTIKQIYDQPENDLKGVILIGNIVAAWYKNYDDFNGNIATFPMDLFYMDLNGEWEFSIDDDMYVGHTGEVAPEIWVGRIDATTLSGETIDIYKNYFDKNHAYRTGDLKLPNRALLYIDDDWSNYCQNYKSHHQILYPYTTCVAHKDGTNGIDYKNRLTWDYDWITVMAHSSPNGHSFRSDYENSYVSSNDIKNIDPHGLFYNLFACSAAQFQAPNYVAGNYLFADTYGVAVIGSTKTGSMNYFNEFHQPLSQGNNLGDSFKEWFNYIAIDGFSISEIRWYYGMGVFGDPTLHPNIPNDIPVSYINNLNDYSKISGTIELSGSVRRGLQQGSTFDSFWIDFGHGINPTKWSSEGASNYGGGFFEFENEFFGNIDTSKMIEDDFYSIRVTVTDDNGQNSTYRKVIKINNLEFNYPLQGDFIKAGDVLSIQGSVHGPALFKKYIIEYGIGNNPSSWSAEGITLTQGGRLPVIDGELATWNTSSLSQSEYYSLRISRVNNDGSIFNETITIVLDPNYRSGWPQKTISPVYNENMNLYSGGVAVADINNDGFKETFISTYVTEFPDSADAVIHGWDSNGNSLPGWPKTNEDWTAGSTPVIGDVTGDGNLEIVCFFSGSTSAKGIYVWKYDGTLLPGWPKIINNVHPRSVSLADITNDKTLEIIALADNYVYVLDDNSNSIANFPLYVGDLDTASSLAVADIDSDGYTDIVLSSSKNPQPNSSMVTVIRHDATIMPGWPRFFDSELCSPVSLADINNDGMQEIIVGTSENLYVFSYNNVILTGWPQAFTADEYSSIAVADISRNGELEIIAMKKINYDTSELTVFNKWGQIAPGWPLILVGANRRSPIVADINGDYDLEIILVYGDDKLGAWHYDGTRVEGWTKIIPIEADPLMPGIRSSPVVTDINGDFTLNVILASKDLVLVWDLNSFSTPGTIEWGCFRHDSYNTARYDRINEVYVDDDFNSSIPGWGITRFSTIQEGVDAVEENGSVYVFSGLYAENIVISKPLSLIGITNEKITIFALTDNQPVILVNADNVLVKGLTIKGSGSAGIYVTGAFSCIIKDNVLDENNDGIYLINSDDNSIVGNEIRSCNHKAIVLWFSENNEVSENMILRNTYGICLEESSANIVLLNTLIGNEYGIRLFYSNDNIISSNIVKKNNQGISLMQSSSNNIIFNNLFDNDINVIDEGVNFWNSDEVTFSKNIIGGPFIGGNFWSDYSGIDENVDGLGDTPYVISIINNNLDNYPLLYSWSTQCVFVDDDYTSSTLGWGYNHFETITQGVSVVEEYGTVFVNSGVYNEQIGIPKPMALVGENKHSTVINGYGVLAHPALRIGNDNISVQGLTIKGITAVCLRQVQGCALQDSIIKESNVGIQLQDSSHENIFSQNIITGNMKGINVDASSENNVFYHNDFVVNEMHAFDRSFNTWYNEEIQQGNYWDDYNGVDEDGDGIGDTPYEILGGLGGFNQDMFPLMDPFNSRQTIVFNEGRNLVSFNVLPSNMSMSRIMKPLIDQGILEVMQDGGTGVLWPAYGIDTIGDMDVTKGYKVKVTQDAMLEVRGLAVQMPIELSLQKDWNLVGYPVSEPRNALSVLQPLIDQNILIRVRDQHNNEIYRDTMNDMWINNIGDFQPGQGYHINVLSESSLIIPE